MSEQQIALAAPRRLVGVSARSLRKWVQTIHLWAGIVLCFPMIVIGLSGSALILQREILGAAVPAASGTGAVQSISEIVAAAQTAMAPEIRANWIEIPSSRGRPAAVRFDVARRPTQTVAVYVDPVSLEILGTSDVIRRGPISRFLLDIHGFLLMPSGIGLRTVGWFGVAMTFMGLSGLILWWPRKGQWLRALTVARGARGLRLHLDLHKVIGFWGLIVFLVLCVSGIYLAFPQSVSGTVRMLFPAGPGGSEQGVTDIAKDWPADANEAILVAASAVPDARVIAMQLPRETSNRYVVHMESTRLGPVFPPITVAFDRDNDELISVDDPRAYSPSARMLNLLYAVHLSLGMGRVWTYLIVLAGFMPLFLAVTGTTIWWMRRRVRTAHSR